MLSEREASVMKLLMHICCAPCANMPIDALRAEGVELTGYWYNPNIHPFTEYRARRNCLQEYAKTIDLPLLVRDDYGLRPFVREVADDIAGRCVKCYEMRLFEAARAAKITGKEFDSLGEYEYYIGTVAPKVARGEIVEGEAHPCFPLFPAGQYGALKLRPVRYTADFRLVYADGTVEIVEIKSKFVRRMQRDYPVRRRVFLELIARPAGWKFTEIITAEDKEEIKRWRELAEEVSSCGKNG